MSTWRSWSRSPLVKSDHPTQAGSDRPRRGQEIRPRQREAKAPDPISFKNNDDKFWYEYLPEKRMVYFQYNQVGNKEGETLEKFCGRCSRSLTKNQSIILSLTCGTTAAATIS